MIQTDLIIIGSGPGGYQAARYAAQQGLKVVIVENSHAGGTCLNCGCIPTKTFAHEAELLRNPLLTDEDRLRWNFNTLLERKQAIVEQLRKGVETILQHPNITFVKGFGRLSGIHSVTVGDEEFTAKNIILATGSHAKLPPVDGINDPSVMTSTELLSCSSIPKQLCIIGAGVIGMEFASAFNAFGCKVTVVEYMKECLPTIDGDIAKRLRKSLEKQGVTFIMQAGVSSIQNGTVTYEKKGKQATVVADSVLVATGRAANTDNMGLEGVGVEFNRQGIVVDDNMQTNIPGIYAIGDVNGKMMLAHAATFQGYRAINHILGKDDLINFDIMPAAIFTYPEAASVGISEENAKQAGLDYSCGKGFYRANGKALSMGETEGLLKLIADKDGKIIGCHVFGVHAADLVQEVTSLMNKNATVEDLKNIIHIHPTVGEILLSAAASFE